LITVEVFAGIGIFLAWPLVLLVKFFQKKMEFPRLYVLFLFVGAAYFFADLYLTWFLFSKIFAAAGIEFFDRDTIRGIVSALVGLVVWVPYMWNSVRVKNTFVN
jgi:hypothetical protein